MKNKTDLRIIAKNTRKNLPMADISSDIVNNIKLSEIYKAAKNIMLFYPLKYEINLLPLVEDNNKKFYLPRVNKELLEVCHYIVGDSLIKSVQKVMEPQSESVDKQNLDLVLIPALMADKEGYRLGYGGGYYDRFLDGISANKAVVIPEKLIIDKLPIDKFDVKCDFLISEKSLFKVK